MSAEQQAMQDEEAAAVVVVEEEMTVNDLDQEIIRLENVELDGSLTVPQYACLLACYLAVDDLKTAQFLWKRIPAYRKKETDDEELIAVWSVGQKLWEREIPKAYDIVKKREWTANLKPIMHELVERMRERMMNLVGKAYSSVSLDYLSALIDSNPDAALVTIKARGWPYDEATKMVIPKNDTVANAEGTNDGQQQLGKLCQFVSFLEN